MATVSFWRGRDLPGDGARRCGAASLLLARPGARASIARGACQRRCCRRSARAAPSLVSVPIFSQRIAGPACGLCRRAASPWPVRPPSSPASSTSTASPIRGSACRRRPRSPSRARRSRYARSELGKRGATRDDGMHRRCARLTTLGGTGHMMIFEAPLTCRGLVLDEIAATPDGAFAKASVWCIFYDRWWRPPLCDLSRGE